MSASPEDTAAPTAARASGRRPAVDSAARADHQMGDRQMGDRWQAERRALIDQTAAAVTETAQLKETINALRDAMETARIGEGERTQKALAAAEGEMRDLRATIDALRDQLERQRIGEGERTQKALADANAEIAQTKAAVVALRDQLDIQKREHLAALEERSSGYVRETQQLHETIRQLRARLEGARA